MIIEYFLEYDRSYNSCGAICCGQFDSWEAFDNFERVQKSYGKRISQVRLVKV